MNGAAIQQYLLAQGWTPYRLLFAGKDPKWVRCDRPEFFSTMLQVPDGPSYVTCYWRKDGNGDRPPSSEDITYGLSEFGKPPTLTYPRPRGAFDDDSMNRILRKYSAEEVVAACLDRSIKLEP